MPHDLDNFLDPNYIWHLISYCSIAYPNLLLGFFDCSCREKCFIKICLFFSYCDGLRHNMNFLMLTKKMRNLVSKYRKLLAVAYDENTFTCRMTMKKLVNHFNDLSYREIRARITNFIRENINAFNCMCRSRVD